MHRKAALAALLTALLAAPSPAQHHGSGHQGHQQPYAGLEQREIKALSQEQIAQLRAGHGMGLALAAELNGYPGPKHILEHAERLGLTAAQRDQAEALFNAMKSQAMAAGEAVIAAEIELDALFASGKADEVSLDAAMHKAGHAHMMLRRTHLAYHLPARSVLTEAQITAYQAIRGYAPR
jgi:Spy/CpxP family protein refolding chaperone